MRPDNDEDVEADDKTEESRIDNVIVTVVKVADDLDEVEEEADDGQNKPGHHKSGLRLKTEMKISFQQRSSIIGAIFAVTFLAPWMSMEATTT